MALSRKPKPSSKTDTAPDERAIEALIAKGGSVALEAAPERGRAEPRSTNVVLRLPPGLLDRVDAAVEQRNPRIPRHTWLLEAVLGKLEQEEGS